MKNKEINFSDIKNSPYTIAVVLALVIVLVIAAISYLIYDIVQIKTEIVDVRTSYEQNLREIAVLEELRAQSEKAEQQLEVYKGILPDALGDIYVLQEEQIATLENFGLEVTSVEVLQVPAQTQETTFVFGVKGKFENIHSYMAYISSLKQIHRFDTASLTKDGDLYTATISLAILSQNGAEGIVSAVIDEAVAS